MPSKGTTARAVRIDDDLWARVQARATAEGVTPSDVIRDLLRQWVDSPPVV